MLLIICVIWVHFLADFVLQTDKMAMNKSSSNYWLTAHLLVYSGPLLMFGWRFALANFCLHWITDFFSSRATSALWKKNKRHWFFVVIGFDQAVHMTCLMLTLPLVTGWV